MTKLNSTTLLNSSLLLCLKTILSCTAVANPNIPTLDKHQTTLKTSLIAQHQTTGNTWLSADLGRYDLSNENFLAELQFGYSYRANPYLSFNTHIQAQRSTESRSSTKLGLVEWNVNFKHDINWQNSVSVTAGQFFLPTSLENTEEFWDSPYSIHYSALNTWIGEEFRPIGLDAEYQYFTKSHNRISLAATIFGGNDSMGALLAYRGWSIGRHRSALGDVLSLPELDYLRDTGTFSKQRDDGTRPFGKELDNKPGVALRTRFVSDQLLLSASWIDNRGDRALHRGEYAWDTQFAIIGAAWLINDQWELVSEAMQGRSVMGSEPGIDIGFYATYIMASFLYHDKRFSLRAEQFSNNDKDTTDNESHDFGRAYSMTVSWFPDESNIKVDAELIYLNAKRSRVIDANTLSDDESVSLSLMLSYTL